jgi:hypothetical protein
MVSTCYVLLRSRFSLHTKSEHVDTRPVAQLVSPATNRGCCHTRPSRHDPVAKKKHELKRAQKEGVSALILCVQQHMCVVVMLNADGRQSETLETGRSLFLPNELPTLYCPIAEPQL